VIEEVLQWNALEKRKLSSSKIAGLPSLLQQRDIIVSGHAFGDSHSVVKVTNTPLAACYIAF
jgi:hypothetical protein